MKILVPLAEGVEEMEAVIVIDTLRRAGFEAWRETIAGALVFLLGGMAFSIYPLSLSHACDELRPDQVVQVRWGHGVKGCMAAELRPDGPPPGLPPKH